MKTLLIFEILISLFKNKVTKSLQRRSISFLFAKIMTRREFSTVLHGFLEG